MLNFIFWDFSEGGIEDIVILFYNMSSVGLDYDLKWGEKDIDR